MGIRKEFALKMLPVFGISRYVAPKMKEDGWGIGVRAGLKHGLIGDVIIDPKGVQRSRTDPVVKAKVREVCDELGL